MHMNDIRLPIERAFQGDSLLGQIRIAQEHLHTCICEWLRESAAAPKAKVCRIHTETAVTEGEVSRDSLQAAGLQIMSNCQNTHSLH